MHSEDLKKGDWITVISWKKRERIHDNMMGQILVETIQDRSYCGDLLQVLAVDHPFVAVVVDHYRKAGVPDMVVSLDLTEVKIQKCSDEYVEVMRKKP
jgi:hypothetical protein